MNLFNNILKDDESLFTDEIALDFDYTPPIIKHREKQQKYIAESIKPLFHSRNGKNLLITGKPGIGKTLAVRKVFEELKKETDEILPIFINCWKKDTFHKIMLEICEKIKYNWHYNKKTDEVFKDVSKILNKKRIVFCFDEIDKLKEQQVIYSILEDINQKTIIIITNELNFFSKLDPRIKSRLTPDTLEFHPYNFDETKSILEYRKNFAFVKDVWEDSAFNLISEKTFELKDIRTGLFLLRESGNMAELGSSRKIIEEHSKNAIEKLKHYKIKDSLSLNEDEKWILDFIKENPKTNSTIVFENCQKDFPQSLRNFQRKIKRLSEANSITITEKLSEKGGKIYILDVPENEKT